MAVYIAIGRVTRDNNRKQTIIGLLFLYIKSYTRNHGLRISGENSRLLVFEMKARLDRKRIL